MKLTPAAELAVRGVSVLAEEYGRGPISLSEVCKRRDLARQYLVKIFGILSRAGLIVPVRGKRGGYMLARQPKDITLLEIIETVEGPLALNLCQYMPPRCSELDCPLRPVWQKLQRIVRNTLGSVTMASCAGVQKRLRQR
ncbi:MAG: RrF2 family transcriptional regulator [Planctomycetota bacterium]|jgi:Rrf2 family protein